MSFIRGVFCVVEFEEGMLNKAQGPLAARRNRGFARRHISFHRLLLLGHLTQTNISVEWIVVQTPLTAEISTPWSIIVVVGRFAPFVRFWCHWRELRVF